MALKSISAPRVSSRRTCEMCPIAGQPRVYGHGKLNPKVMFIAEAPGETEVEQGEPLVGKSGQLLRRTVRSLNETDADCYFTNTCICRPAGNATPNTIMVNACYDGLWEEIERVRPQVIVLLGNVSIKAVGQYERKVTRVHGAYRILELSDGTRVGLMPTFHPAAVLRNPNLFRDFAGDIERAFQIANGDPATIPPPVHNYQIVETYDHLEEVWPEFEKARVLAIDLETASRDVFNDKVLDIGIGYERGRAASIAWSLFEKNRKWFRKLKKLLETKGCSFQTASFDIVWLMVRGIEPNLVFDTEIADWLLDERVGGHDLDTQATKYYHAPRYKEAFRRRFGIPPYINDEDKFRKLWAAIPDRARRVYNATDSDYTWRLTVDHLENLKRDGIPLKLMRTILDSTMLYARLYIQGISVDTEYLDELDAKLEADIQHYRGILQKMAPHVNPLSTKQLANYLYDELKLKTFGDTPPDNRPIPEDTITMAMREVDDPEAREYWQTRRVGLYEGAGTAAEGRGLRSRSTTAFMLYYLAQQHEYPRMVIRFKQVKKLKATYITNLRKYLWPDNRLRPDYKLDGTEVGRFKTSRPALHNIPFGSDVYNVIVAPPPSEEYPEGWQILHADYRQVDLRMMAHFSGDENLIEWLKGDPHTEVAKVLGHWTDEDVARLRKEDEHTFLAMRIAAKMVNFGIPYGRGPANLAPQLGVSVKEAKQYIVDYWKRLPKLRKWTKGLLQELLNNNQELTSPFGNKRRFPLILDDKHKLEISRLSVHFPIMSSVNYLSAIAHVWAMQALEEVDIPVEIYPHIHDSINLAVPGRFVQQAAPIIAEVMASVPRETIGATIPFPVEVQAGYRWGTMEKIYEGDGSEPKQVEPKRTRALK